MIRKSGAPMLAKMALVSFVMTAHGAETYVTPAVMYTSADKDREVEDGFEGGQVSFGWILSDRWALEAMGGYSRLNGAEDLRISEASLNAVFALTRESVLTPYLLGGLGVMQTNPQFGDNENSMLANAGFGLRMRFGDSPFGLRLEHRLRLETANTLDFNDRITTLGLQFSFGNRPVPVPAPVAEQDGEGDGDGDGVPDSLDQCPETPEGVAVDSRGCALDYDSDGVIDALDLCPDTYRGAAVDPDGCEVDRDSDGVVDRLDRCPSTTSGARVDARGCEIREIIELPGVNFESNSDRLLPGAESVLADAAETLRNNRDLVVEVAGHTDDSGAADYNASLSERRASTVRDYLVNLGVDDANLSVRGYGEEMPVADNGTADGRARNRRVELRILNRDQL